ncbi:alpha/beta fold hydrolase [Pyxidicoccus xibeiensis]|uniref:alpha/beta fold hydrolase n=1 Tax=Pyxidicoccus xibeiensis TaxID=2906759 RepID=UPI0020A7C9DA|nr:hypothetical protein [Pyxidicoccus xibeiensis]MCP3142228.1 hypothetical protein [Pyxidicoccus xibeiensis]
MQSGWSQRRAWRGSPSAIRCAAASATSLSRPSGRCTSRRFSSFRRPSATTACNVSPGCPRNGKGDPLFSVAGAKAYKKDLKNIELHLLDTGHFALEEDAPAIAEHIEAFMATKVSRKAR